MSVQWPDRFPLKIQTLHLGTAGVARCAGMGRMKPGTMAEVFLLAENRLLREALIRLLSKKADVRVVGASAYAPGVQQEIVAARPNILVLDSSGLGLPPVARIPALQAALPELRVVMVDMEPDEQVFLRAVRAGVLGYVLKNASAVEVASTIRAVAMGEAICPASLSVALFRCVAQPESAPAALPWAVELGLSRREQEMAELLSQRLTNKEIAVRLHLSEQTVKNHVHHILRKLGAHNRSAIVERCQVPRPRPGAA